MGAGKTTTGQMLAKRLGWGWRDSDIDIEASTGKTVRALRDSEGVDAMHRREAAQLLDALGVAGTERGQRRRERRRGPRRLRRDDEAGCRGVLAPRQPAGPGHQVRFRATSTDRRTARIPAAFLAAQAAHREPLIASIGAHRIDVDGLTPDEVVARVADVLGSIGA